MASIQIKGLLVKHQWRITRDQGMWYAHIPDSKMPDTGAPAFEDAVLDRLIDKIEIFEMGATHASNTDKCS